MPEDKLTHDQRLRLEALSQANFTTQGRAPPETVLEVATLYLAFIQGATLVAGSDNKQ